MGFVHRRPRRAQAPTARRPLPRGGAFFFPGHGFAPPLFAETALRRFPATRHPTLSVRRHPRQAIRLTRRVDPFSHHFTRRIPSQPIASSSLAILPPGLPTGSQADASSEATGGTERLALALRGSRFWRVGKNTDLCFSVPVTDERERTMDDLTHTLRQLCQRNRDGSFATQADR